MVNDKYLNSKPEYKIPAGTLVGKYSGVHNGVDCYREPRFEPTLCINRRGTVGVSGYKDSSNQLWVYTDDECLINYLKSYDFKGFSDNISIKSIELWMLKKIISDYYEARGRAKPHMSK